MKSRAGVDEVRCGWNWSRPGFSASFASNAVDKEDFGGRLGGLQISVAICATSKCKFFFTISWGSGANVVNTSGDICGLETQAAATAIVMSLDPKSSLDTMSSGARQLPLYAELVQLSDEILMQRLRDGHHDALAVLFDRYHRLVLNIALRILRDAGEAEDLMQSVFLEIFRCAAQFDPARGTVKVWILQYAYHRGFNRRQYLSLRGIYDHQEDLALNERSSAAWQAKSLGEVESAQAVRQALKHLNKAQRSTLELAFYEGLTMREIAGRTGESFDSVRHHYYRGLEKLRSILCDVEGSQQASSSHQERIPHVQP